MNQLYKNHQDANVIDVHGSKHDFVSQSASVKDNVLTLSITNFHHEDSVELNYELGLEVYSIEASYITGDELDAHNTFDNPNVITKQLFNDYKLDGSQLNLTLPSKSICTFTIKLS